MKTGFTGTQKEPTLAQVQKLNDLLKELATELHHGCCIGADTWAHGLAHELNIPIIGHPPINLSKKAELDYDHQFKELWHEKPYLDRNRDIVEQTKIMIAMPKGYAEERRSGTWYTVRHARALKRKIYIIRPDGTVRIEEGYV